MVSGIEDRLSIQVNRTAYCNPDPNRNPLNDLMFRYFSARAALLMLSLTATLLFLPLVLPPLPPPPLSLLLLPVAIMAVLVFLAFAPPQLPNVAFSSV